jgi:hypothetical protein
MTRRKDLQTANRYIDRRGASPRAMPSQGRIVLETSQLAMLTVSLPSPSRAPFVPLRRSMWPLVPPQPRKFPDETP